MAPKKKTDIEEPAVLPKKMAKTVESHELAKKTTPGRKTATRKQNAAEAVGMSIDPEHEKSVLPVQDPEVLAPTDAVKPNRGALLLGAGLLLMGLLLLTGKFLSIPFGDYMWPFIFIIPGILLLLSSVTSESSSGEGLSILGAMLASLGLIFFFQSVTGLWASWAYIWALVAPGSVGAAQVIYGTRHHRDAIVHSGKKLVNIGLTIFVIGFIFFELIIGVNGFGIANLGLPVFPVMLVFAGIIILFRALLKK